jgi:hypothetical protein
MKTSPTTYVRHEDRKAQKLIQRILVLKAQSQQQTVVLKRA